VRAWHAPSTTLNAVVLVNRAGALSKVPTSLPIAPRDNAIEGTESAIVGAFFLTAKKFAPGDLGLLQQYLPRPDLCSAAQISSFDSIVGA
jgi:hypothetical protein